MSLLTNSAEGGTNGTTVTAANSGGGSGNAFSSVTIGSGAALTYASAAAAHGTLGYSLTGAASTVTTISWSSFSDTSVTARFYYNPGATLPSTLLRLLDIRNSTGTAARIQLSATNQLFMQNNAGTTVFTSATPLTTNTWYRIECAISISATTATMKYDYYLLDSTMPVEAGYSTTTGNTGSANITTVNFGSLGTASWTGTSYFDDMATQSNTTTYLGTPATAPPAVTAGSNQLVTPYSSVTLTGTCTPAPGHTATLTWAPVNGGPAITSGAHSLTATIASMSGPSLTPGATAADTTYAYSLTAVQDDSQTASASVNVTVTFANRYDAHTGSWTPQPLTKRAHGSSWV